MLAKLNPLTIYSSRDDAVQKLAKRVSVTNLKKSNVFTIFCEAQTPEAARLIVEKMIDTAREAYTRVNRTAGSVDFFTEQTAAEKKQLDRLESRLRDLKNRTGVAALDTQREMQVKQIGALDEQQHAADRALKAAGAMHGALESQLGKQQPTIVTAETIGLADTAAARMREQLYALEIRQQELESRETPAHPQLIQIKAQVAQAHETLGQEITPSQVTKGEQDLHRPGLWPCFTTRPTPRR